MTKKLYEIAADLVQAQVATSALSSEEIINSLKTVFNTLSSMQKSEYDGTLLTSEGMEEASSEEAMPAVTDPMDSIQQDKIICLECGAEMRQLTAKHLSTHSIGIREYKKKYGFPLKQSLSSKALSKARSKAAKKRGLPENLIKYKEKNRIQKAEETMETPVVVEDVVIPEVVIREPMEIQETNETKAKQPKDSKKKS